MKRSWFVKILLGLIPAARAIGKRPAPLIEDLEAEAESLRMQLAGCGVAAQDGDGKFRRTDLGNYEIVADLRRKHDALLHDRGLDFDAIRAAVQDSLTDCYDLTDFRGGSPDHGFVLNLTHRIHQRLA